MNTKVVIIQGFGLISSNISAVMLYFNSLLRVRHSFCFCYLITSKCYLLSPWKYFLTVFRFSLEISFVHNPCLAQLMKADMISSESNTAGSHLFYTNKPHHHGTLWGTGCDFRGERKAFFLRGNGKGLYRLYVSNTKYKNIHIMKFKPNEISRKRSIINKCRILFFHRFTHLIFHCLSFIYFLSISFQL